MEPNARGEGEGEGNAPPLSQISIRVSFRQVCRSEWVGVEVGVNSSYRLEIIRKLFL